MELLYFLISIDCTGMVIPLTQRKTTQTNQANEYTQSSNVHTLFEPKMHRHWPTTTF
jgi:hypothetical protein